MREALVAARVGLDDLRRALGEARARVEAARAELETTRRRGRLAAEVHDAETVAVAARFAESQASRVGVLEAKAEVQAREVALAERELADMTAEYRRLAATGQMHASEPPEAAGGTESGSAASPDANGPNAADPRPTDPDALLAALKRRMGK